MAKKEFKYKGKKLEELQQMTLKEFAEISPSRIRRSISRGFNDSQQILLNKIRKNKGKAIKTHCRSIVILPEMVGKTIMIHTGKAYQSIEIVAEMLGHVLGEYALTRNRVAHSSPGVGATRSSAHVSVK